MAKIENDLKAALFVLQCKQKRMKAGVSLWLCTTLLKTARSFIHQTRYYRPRLATLSMSTTTNSARTSDCMEGLPQPLILGSASFTRKLILKEMNIDYKIVVRPIDERGLGNRESDTPQELVSQLANAKMDHLVEQISTGQTDLPPNQPYIVLTADQVVTCQGKILEKPDSVAQAKEFVERYKTAPCSTVGAVVVTHVPSQTRVCGLHVATIHFQSSMDARRLVDDLLAESAPILSCAGGLMIEHPLTKAHVERMEGSEDSIMGLSKDTVRELLDELRGKLNERGLL